MPGPAPKPTSLKLLAGNPGKRPLNAAEPKPDPAIPDCPDHLTPEARAEWDRIVPELEALGLLTRIDRAALAAYCTAYGRWVEAERMVKEHGLTVETPNGYPVKSPWLSTADKALDQLRKFIQEFGLSPASRSKVAATPKSTNDDEAFFT